MECEISRSGKEQPSRLCGDQKEGAAARLLAWYGRHRRNLPWRAAPGERAEPYKVWLSEIMLQQTTAAAVKPYFTASCPAGRMSAVSPGPGARRFCAPGRALAIMRGRAIFMPARESWRTN